MLSVALLICAVTLFIGMSMFMQYLIKPVTMTLDTQPVEDFGHSACGRQNDRFG